jgi:hypothetical protein
VDTFADPPFANSKVDKGKRGPLLLALVSCLGWFGSESISCSVLGEEFAAAIPSLWPEAKRSEEDPFFRPVLLGKARIITHTTTYRRIMNRTPSLGDQNRPVSADAGPRRYIICRVLRRALAAVMHNRAPVPKI